MYIIHIYIYNIIIIIIIAESQCFTVNSQREKKHVLHSRL